jgi:hypothetical protein
LSKSEACFEDTSGEEEQILHETQLPERSHVRQVHQAQDGHGMLQLHDTADQAGCVLTADFQVVDTNVTTL